jgi:hypothetical protein
MVRTRGDLAAFLADLSERVRRHPTAAANGGAAAYIEAASGWLADLDGFDSNRGERVPDQPSWDLVAAIFEAALIYE